MNWTILCQKISIGTLLYSINEFYLSTSFNKWEILNYFENINAAKNRGKAIEQIKN